MPPNLGSVWLRERRCEPTPHDLLHVVQAVQPRVTQFTEQACVLQRRELEALPGHWLPPCFGAGLLQVRVRVCVPEPQDLEHALYAPYADQPPSMGQCCVLQARVSE